MRSVSHQMMNKSDIVHVCGSRYGYTVVTNEYTKGDTDSLSDEHINRLFARALYATEVNQTSVSEVVHGDNDDSPDRWASKWADNHTHIENTAYPADWDEHGKAAGPIRNEEMVNYLCEQIESGRVVTSIAFFWDENGKSKGTQDMINKLKSNGIDPTVFRINNKNTRELLFAEK